MSSAPQIISILKQQQVRLSLQEDQLKVSAPEGVLTADLIEQLKLHKQDIIHFLRAQAGQEEYESIIPVPDQDHYSVSFAQRRLWILDQFEKNQIAYNMAGAHMIYGKLDKSACIRAFNTLIKRHEILRTVFLDVDGEPRQKVLSVSDAGFEIGFLDIAGEDDQMRRIRELSEIEINTPFDLLNGPLLRAKIIRAEESKNVLLLSMHHIISDGWSISIFFRELVALYTAFSEGREIELPPLKLQYRDYAAWHLAQQQESAIAGHREFWRNMLKGELPVLQLPLMQTRPAVQTFNGRSRTFLYVAELNRELNILSRRYNASLFMTLLAVLKVLLYKYTGQTDIIIGTDAAARLHKDLENNIGFYLDALVLRTTFNPEDTFEQLLLQIRDNTLNAYEHQIYPFDNLMNDLNIRRDLSRNPIFDVLVIMQNFGDRTYPSAPKTKAVAQPEKTAEEEVSIDQIDLDVKASLVDLEFAFKEVNGQLLLGIRYNTDLFSGDFVNALGRQFAIIAAAAVENPRKSVWELDFLTPEEKRRMTGAYDTPSSLPFKPLPERIARGSRTAIVWKDQHISYDMLMQETMHTVSAFHQLGLQPQQRVALMMKPSPRLFASMLACMKAGLVFVPVDPELPLERAQFLINDCEAKYVITENRLPGGEPGAVNDTPNETSIHPSDLCYIMYTSGSTGTPKGVMIEHCALADYVQTFSSSFNISEEDVVLQQSSVSFDTIMEEVFPAFCSGAKIVIVENGGRDVAALYNCLVAEKATVLSTTPAILQELDKYAVSLYSLRLVISGGDVLYPSSIPSLLEKFPVYNTYGPTECTVCVTFHKTNGLPDGGIIGKAIPNHTIMLLNEHMQLVPDGVTGEICVMGSGIARGYLNDEHLTAQKFITSPFGSKERMYRTGDLGKRLPDGNIVFVGRKDHQVKIRGYRVEPAEIDHHLLLHPALENALTVFSTQGGHAMLATYYKPREKYSTVDLHKYLSALLPDYMVPAVFIPVADFPLTATGKTDRHRLPDIHEFIASIPSVVSRVDVVENVLLEIWKDVLALKTIGVHDNFFSIGGHSIKAIKAISLIQRELRVPVQLKHLFKAPTIRALSTVIRSLKTPLQQLTATEPALDYPLSHGQKGILLKYLFSKKRLPFNMGRELIVNGLDPDLLKKSVQLLMDRHETLRTTFVIKNGEMRQVVHPLSAFPFEINVMAGGEEGMQLFLQKRSTIIFDVFNGPLMDVTIFHLSETRYAVIFTIDHIIADAWSLQILMRDFNMIYNSLERGMPLVLPPLHIQFKDYAGWQEGYFASSASEEDSAYWVEKLKDVPLPAGNYAIPYRTSLQLDAASYFRKMNETEEKWLYGNVFSLVPLAGASCRLTITGTAFTGLKALTTKADATLFATLAVSLHLLMKEITGVMDIVIGTPVTIRQHESLAELSGWFLDTLAIRCRLDQRETPEEMIRKAAAETFASYDHILYPFEKVLQDLDRSLNSLTGVFLHVIDFEGYRMITDTQRTHRPTGTPTFSLNFTFEPYSNGLVLVCDYRTDLYSPVAIDLMLDQYLQILNKMVCSS